MKKVIFLFLLFITTSVYAEERTFIEEEYMDVYYNGVINNTFVSNRFVYKEYGDIPIYCLSFNVPISRETGYGIYDLKNNETYTQDQKKFLELISFFGYKYQNHNDIKYYLATQDLIWGSLGTDVYWTYTKNGSDYIDLSQYKMDILNLYAEYMNENNLLTENYTLEVGNSYFYEDYNILLHQYNYFYYGNSEIQVIPSGVIINAYQKGQESIMMSRVFEKGYESKLFLENGYQTIFMGGNLPSKDRMLNFDIRNTTLKIIRINADELENSNYNNKNIKLEGAIYNIYDINYNYISTVTTDKNGEAIIYDLPLGIYRIKEEKESYGFEPYEYYYDATLSFGNTPGVKELYVNPIKKELSITNIYKIDGTEYYDPGIKFELYRDGILIKTLETNSNGKINTKLDYGKYKIKQITSREEFDLEPEFEFEVNELENNLNYIFIKEKNTETNIDDDIVDNIPVEEDNNEKVLETDEKPNEIIEIEKKIFELEEEKPTDLEFETNNEIEIEKLPRLSETKDIFDILCENLLLLFL